MLRRPLIALLIAALFAVTAGSMAGAAGVPKPAAATLATSSLKVKSCKSSAYYAARDLTFRTKIMWQDLSAQQKISVKLVVYRKLNEAAHYRKLKLPKLAGWKSPENKGASLYQYDWTLDDVETAASYRAKATFLWKNATTGAVEARRSVWSKVCKQRTALPKLRIAGVSSLPIAGSNSFTHVISVANKGASEAVDVPVAVFVDAGGANVGKIDSIGPKQTVDVQITAPDCTAFAYARIQATPALKRPRVLTSQSTNIPTCR